MPATPELSQAHKDKLSADLRLVIEDAQDVLTVLANQTSQEAQRLRNRMESRLSQARQDLVRLQQQTMEQLRHSCENTDAFVHQHPWAASGVAASVGLILGMLVARR